MQDINLERIERRAQVERNLQELSQQRESVDKIMGVMEEGK